MSSFSPGTRSVATVAAADTLAQDDEARARAAELSAPRLVPPGDVPGYEIGRCLGFGAFGSVWLAAETNTGKQVAVKFYSHRRGLDWSLLSREVEKLAALYTSRDIVGLLQVGWDADPPYYVMEYLQNGSLARMLDGGALPVPEVVRIATAVTGALVHAHQQGILHCDVKPANVLLDAHFSPRLADFGQARLSHEQSPALGTLYYMAPEQADLNAVPDQRWDVYALGALLYHMLCGEPPFKSPENEKRISAGPSLEKKLAVYREVVSRGPPPSRHRAVRGVDSRLADIVDRCLAVQPEKRFRDASAVARALAKRARYRSLRPIIALGVLLPALLVLSLLPLAVKAVMGAAETAERNIASRALESELVAAKILAFSLNDDLQQRTSTLAEIAQHPELLALMPGATAPAGSSERKALGAWLAEEKHRIDDIRRRQNADLDESWFLNDAQGFQRWREPASTASFERNYAWRDYFHGGGADRSDWQGRTDVPPLTRPHVSAPFRSTTTGQMKVALSVPVRDPSSDKVLGVLCRTIHLGELLTSYKRLVQDARRDDAGERVIALVDVTTGVILDHPWMTNPENRRKLVQNEVFDRMTLWEEERRELEKLVAIVGEGRVPSGQQFDVKYFDPVRKVDAEAQADYGMPWLAAFWPVGNTGWVAVIQERRDEALNPVREITEGLIKYGLGGLALCLTLVCGSWYFVRRAMRARRFGPGLSGRFGGAVFGSGDDSGEMG